MRRAIPSSVCILAVTLCGCGSSTTQSRGTTDEVQPELGNGTVATISVEPPASVTRAGGRPLAEYRAGRTVAVDFGCLACHRIGAAGNAGPGPDLTEVAGRLPPLAIERLITHAKPPMPSFVRLPKDKLKALVAFLSQLR
jgi:menaquinol-cytochrome c reductase cytochrome b/c subunit